MPESTFIEEIDNSDEDFQLVVSEAKTHDYYHLIATKNIHVFVLYIC